MSPEKKPEQISLDLNVPSDGGGGQESEVDVESGPVLEWVSHPARRNMKVTISVSLFLAVLIFLVYVLTYSIFFTVLAIIILYASLAAFYFPTRYRLDSEKIAVKTMTQTLHKNWSQYRSYYPDKNGVLLSPFVRPSRLENFRGLYIRFGDNREEVTSFIKKRMETMRTHAEKGK